LISQVLPLAAPYTTGLLLIGLAPAAPFLPMVVRRAGGDLAYTVAFMLIAVICTILLMPLAVPLIVPGLSVDPWAVAKPLLERDGMMSAVVCVSQEVCAFGG